MPREPNEIAEHPLSYPEARDHATQRALCKHVVDGDTFDFLIDLGWYQYAYETIRLHGMDTPEIWHAENNAEEEHAHEAKERVEELILDEPVLLRSYKLDTSFGRFDAHVLLQLPDETAQKFTPSLQIGDTEWYSLANILRAEGFEAKESY